MKTFITLFIGFIAGIFFMLIFGTRSSEENETGIKTEVKTENDLPGLTTFPKKGDCVKIARNLIRVQYVVAPSFALAQTGNPLDDQLYILLTNDKNKLYYDDEIIPFATKNCARQVGLYHYTTNFGVDKTVPVVKIE